MEESSPMPLTTDIIQPLVSLSIMVDISSETAAMFFFLNRKSGGSITCVVWQVLIKERGRDTSILHIGLVVVLET